jgi:ankyrin repeat protein
MDEKSRNEAILLHAICDNQIDKVRELMIKHSEGRFKLDINAPLLLGDPDLHAGWPALHAATFQEDMVLSILEYGKPNVNLVHKGLTPADMAALEGNIYVYYALIKAGGKIHKVTRNKVDDLFNRLQYHTFADMRTLVYTTELVDPDAEVPLSQLSPPLPTELAQAKAYLMLDFTKEEKDEQFRNGKLLYNAMCSFEKDKVKDLLNRYSREKTRFNINAALTRSGMVALHLAAKCDKADLVDTILANSDADINLVHRGMTPADYAISYRAYHAYETLMEKNGKIHRFMYDRMKKMAEEGYPCWSRAMKLTRQDNVMD